MHFLTTANKGYLHFARNLCAQFQLPFMRHHRLAVECLDEITAQALEGYGWPNVELLRSLDACPDFASYGTAGFTKLVNTKFWLVHGHLLRHPSVWVLDCDVAIFRDPEPYLQPGVDIHFQSDSRRALRRPFARNLCTGNFALRQNERSLQFALEIARMSLTFPAQTNQWHLNRWLADQGVRNDVRSVRSCRIDVLSPELFPNGAIAFGRSFRRWPGSVIAHANFVRGATAKKQRLRTCGAWLI